MKKYSILLLIPALCLAFYLIAVHKPRPAFENINNAESVPARIISINPAATEIIFELNCQDKLAAVSDFCNYPPQTNTIEKVGGAINPNFERISILRPDLIIIQGKIKEIVDFCNQRKIECISINLRNINEMYEEITRLGKKLGCSETAEKLCGKIRSRLEEIENKLSTVKKKKVFFSLYRTPGSLAGITTTGPNTLLSELITIAGGINIFNDLKQDYPVISKETLLMRQPDIIIESYTKPQDQISNNIEVLKDWNKLGKMNAVINNNIYIIDPDFVLKPGPRITEAAFELAKLIHPEVFNE